MSATPARTGLRIAALVGVAASLFFSWLMLTPLGFGMTWNELAPSWHSKLLFLAPVGALAAAGLAWLTRRPSPIPEAILLAAPLYQAIYFAVALITRPEL